MDAGGALVNHGGRVAAGAQAQAARSDEGAMAILVMARSSKWRKVAEFGQAGVWRQAMPESLHPAPV